MGSTPTYSSNSAWSTAAINYLQGTGETQQQASRAINMYLGGDTLSGQAQAMVNSAIADLGPAPNQPVPSTVTGTKGGGWQHAPSPVGPQPAPWQPHQPGAGHQAPWQTPGTTQTGTTPGGGDPGAPWQSGANPHTPPVQQPGATRGNPGGKNQPMPGQQPAWKSSGTNKRSFRTGSGTKSSGAGGNGKTAGTGRRPGKAKGSGKAKTTSGTGAGGDSGGSW